MQKAVQEIAVDIAIIEPEPEDWSWWVGYLLEKMEAEAKSRKKSEDFYSMLKSLMDDIIGQ